MSEEVKTAWEDTKNSRGSNIYYSQLIGDDVWPNGKNYYSRVIPGVLVDTLETLYWVLPSLGSEFAGKGIWVGKVTPTGERTQASHGFSPVMSYKIDKEYRETFIWFSYSCISDLCSRGGWFSDSSFMLAPCMAQETKFSNYFHVFVNIMPTDYWHGQGIEGLCFLGLTNLI